MPYTRYFKTGQKIFLRTLTAEGYPPEHLESLTAYFQESGSGFFDLLLPYRSREGEEYPFAADMLFEIISYSMGLGLRLTGRFKEHLSRDLIRVAVQDELKVFQHRLHPRLDTAVGLRFTRGRGMLKTFRDQWEKNTRALQKGGDSPIAAALPRTQVNLSTGGIRFRLKAPVESADHCLLLIQFEPNTQAICVLAEVVWTGEIEEGRQVAGMRFISLSGSDRKRLENYIRDHGGN